MYKQTQTERAACTARHHNTRSAYDHHGCRCPQARDEARVYHKRLREGRCAAGLVSPLGFRRRVQALMTLGWPKREIAARMGWSPRADIIDVTLRAARIQRRTHAAMDRIYDELCMHQGPSKITAGRARATGHHPPLSWNDIDRDPEPPEADPGVEDTTDWVAVARAVSGDPPATMRPAERRAAVDQLTRQGRTTGQIAQQVGLTSRHVLRLRSAVHKQD